MIFVQIIRTARQSFAVLTFTHFDPKLIAIKVVWHAPSRFWHNLKENSCPLCQWCCFSLQGHRALKYAGCFMNHLESGIHKQTEGHACTHTHTHTLERACFSSSVLGLYRSWEPWQPNTEGRRIRVLPGRAPSLWQSCLNSRIPWQKQHSTSKW